MIMSSKMYGATQSARIAPVRHISDHCTMSLVFRVDDVSFNADWTLQTAHVCSSGGCGIIFLLKWNPERAGIYGEVLADSTVMQDQFAQALEKRDHEKACFCLRSMIVHAASDFRVGMGKQISVCAPCVVKIECATYLGLTPIAKRSDVCLGQRCRMVRLFMRASLLKKSTVCKRDVLSVRILSTRRLPFWTSYSTKTLSYTLCYVSPNARSQRH